MLNDPPIRAARGRQADAVLPAPRPERWAEVRSAAEARALAAVGERTGLLARGVAFAPGSGWIRA